MKCPKCSSINTRVTETRTTYHGTQLRRRRRCSNCEKRFSTVELPEGMTRVVRKMKSTIDGIRKLLEE